MCTQNVSGHGIGCQVVRTHMVTNIQACEAIQISPPNLSERGSLHSPIKLLRQFNMQFLSLKCYKFIHF